MRPQEAIAVAAEARAELVGRRLRNLVAIIAMDPLPCDAACLTHIVIEIGRRQRGRMASRAHAAAEWMLSEQIPFPGGRRGAVCTGKDGEELWIARGLRMGAAGPFAVNFGVAVSALQRACRIGRRIHPGVVVVIVLPQRREAQARLLTRGDQVTLLRRGQESSLLRGGHAKAALDIGARTGLAPLPANNGAGDRTVFICDNSVDDGVR